MTKCIAMIPKMEKYFKWKYADNAKIKKKKIKKYICRKICQNINVNATL